MEQLIITQNNIDNGKKGTDRCPIGLSIKDRIPGAIVSVASRGSDSAFARVTHRKYSLWQFGPDAARFIQAFDAGRQVYPCVLNFTINK